MSLGRGKMLQSVKQKIIYDREERTTHFQLPDYTNESIEKFCRELAEKSSDYDINDAEGSPAGKECAFGQVKIVTSQFDDAYILPQGDSSSAQSWDSDADVSESSSYSLKSQVTEEGTSLTESFISKSSDSNRSPAKPQKYVQRDEPFSRLAVKWPVPPEPKIENKLNPAPVMGRGRRLQMVSTMSASAVKANPQREIMMACDPSYTNDRIENYLDKLIEKNERGEEL